MNFTTKAILFFAFTGICFAGVKLPDTAVDFRSSDSYAEVAEPIEYVPNTFEAWVNIPADHTGRVGVIAGNFQGGQSRGTINWEIHTNNSMRMYWNNGRPNLISSKARLEGGKWQHIAFVRDKDSGEFYFYINGELKDRFDNIGEDVKLSDHPTGNLLRIGSDYPSSRVPFNGMITDVRIWSVARSEQQIKENMRTPLSGSEENLIGYWRMNDACGEIFEDLARGNNATLHGSAKQTLAVTPSLAANKEFKYGETIVLGPFELYNSVGDVSYQWFFNGKPIEGANESSLTLENLTRSDIGSYYAVVDDQRALTPIYSNTVSLREPDWLMWQYDAARSGETPHRLSDNLHIQWVRHLPEPKRAWRHQWDNIGKLDFDISYSPIVMGDKIFVPSNVTDSVTAYSIETGEQIWRFFADAPVRLAPAAWEGKVYFVSDDGNLYCVSAEDGELEWKFAAAPSDHRLLGNERIISFWSARGGPVIKDNTIYFAAGIWPLHGVFIYALDAKSGDIVWVNDTTSSDYVQLPHGSATGFGGLAPQGYLAASRDTLIVAGGRTPPVYLDRSTGEVISAAFRVKGRADTPGGSYAVHAVDGGGMGKRINEELKSKTEALADQIDGEIFEKIAARDRLFVTTKEGRIYCFGAENIEPRIYDYSPKQIQPQTGEWAQSVESMLTELGESQGYALILSAGSGEILRELLIKSEMHIVVVESDQEKVRSLRDELVKGGVYGTRAAVINAEPSSFNVQPYLFSIIAAENAGELNADAEATADILNKLRPYGGIAWLGGSSFDVAQLSAAASNADIDQVSVENKGEYIFARRGGPLTGAGQWTHQYSDPSHSNFSPDRLVKAPLGLLWFGGPTNANIVPRHGGHGPLPQVSAGRVILPGVETISARCVYTGREIWEQSFPGIGHPFTSLELEERYEQGESVFMVSQSGVGSVQMGSPFISLPDGIYVRYKTKIYRLEPSSGEIVSTFQLPVKPELKGKPDWGHFNITDDFIITTIEPQVFGEKGDYSQVIANMQAFNQMLSDDVTNWDAISSNKLVVMDKNTGDVLWTREAKIGFRHNAITTGLGRLYIVDGLSEGAVELLKRRGVAPESASLTAIDLKSGREVWSKNTDIFGTWLSYSQSRNLLIEGGRQGGSGGRIRLSDEPNDRITTRRGTNGQTLWTKSLERYHGPISIHGDTIYLAPAGSTGRGRAISLLNGEPILRRQAQAQEQWTYNRRYGCNTQNVSENLITFRSGYAAFYDLEHDSGTGFFAGFRSGCSNNLIAADGVLNAPDYTRTCTCSYANQTSVGLIYMPEMSSIEAWTTYDAAPPNPQGYGINFGAPGRRIDKQSSKIWHNIEGTKRRHPSVITDANDSINWVAASYREIVEPVVVENLLPQNYKVRLHFAELDNNIDHGERVFDIFINGSRVLREFCILEKTGGAFKAAAEQFYAEAIDGKITVELKKSSGSKLNPIISGIEVSIYKEDQIASKGL